MPFENQLINLSKYKMNKFVSHPLRNIISFYECWFDEHINILKNLIGISIIKVTYSKMKTNGLKYINIDWYIIESCKITSL